MDDVILSKRLGPNSAVYVTTLDPETFEASVEAATLGDGRGYFVIHETGDPGERRLEVLAKAASFSAAGALFDLIGMGSGI